MTADKARNILMKEERKGVLEEKTYSFKTTARAVGNSNERKIYRTYSKQHSPIY